MSLQSLIFFLARHPLKVVWSIAVLASSIFLYSNNDGGIMGKFKTARRGVGPLFYVHPLEFKSSELSLSSSSPFSSAKDDILRRVKEKSFKVIDSNNNESFDKNPWFDNRILAIGTNSPLDFSSFIPTTSMTILQTDALTQLIILLKSGRRAEMAIFIFGIVGVIYTIIHLFMNFRKIGSTFSLGCTALLMVGLDLLFALTILGSIGLHIPPLLLLEFGPYFIMAVGFKKPYILARRIYDHRKSKGDTVGLLCGVNDCMRTIAVEYGLEVSLFLLFSFSDISGLREFSLLCALILITDAVLLFTFFLGMVAYRLRLHAWRAETEQIEVEGPWKGRLKLFATMLLLCLYSLNVLKTSSAADDSDFDIIKVVEQVVGPVGSLYIAPLTILTDSSSLGVKLSPGAIDVIKEIILKVWPVKEETIGMLDMSQILFTIALPLSLIANYYLYRLARHYRRLINGIGVKGSGNVDNNSNGQKKTTLSSFTQLKCLSSPLLVDNQADDEKVLELVNDGKLSLYTLERQLKDSGRAVSIRRTHLLRSLGLVLDGIPFKDYDYNIILGRNCENVVGYIPLPVGVSSPIIVNDNSYTIPLSTTEGALVASISRGCKAISSSGGATAAIIADGMTRGPVISVASLGEAVKLANWIDSHNDQIKQVFNGTSRFIRLQEVDYKIVGKLVYLRFKAQTSDAMGMNMVSKATEHTLAFLKLEFPIIKIIALSGNYCADKKATALNWINGRGKSAVAEVIIPAKILATILKSTTAAMVETNIAKNLVGSAMAGTINGFNAHAANTVAAMFIALGQDPAQVISSASCLTFMEATGKDGKDLYVSVTMPSIEVGVVGGGTFLPAQKACIKMLNLDVYPEGERSAKLASIIAAVVLAGEISLIASLTEGTLVQAHEMLNRPKTI